MNLKIFFYYYYSSCNAVGPSVPALFVYVKKVDIFVELALQQSLGGSHADAIVVFTGSL